MAYEFNNFVKTVTSAGTAEALKSTNFLVRSAVIQAQGDNTGNIYVGGADVDNTGHFLAAGETFSLPLDAVQKDQGGHDLSKLYIDADVSTDGVIVTFIQDKLKE